MDYINQIPYKSASSIRENINLTQNVNDVTLGYFGSYYSKYRNILPLYNSVTRTPYKLKIVGNSDLKLSNQSNIEVLESVSYNIVYQMESEVDILICICNKKGTQIPGKIYYNAVHNKPIIIILDGENKEDLRNYLNKFERYILCENEENSIRDAIEKAKGQLVYKEFKIVEELTPQYIARKMLENIM